MGYTAIFQEMVEGCPEKSNKVLSKQRDIFKRIESGIYTFTMYRIALYESRKGNALKPNTEYQLTAV